MTILEVCEQIAPVIGIDVPTEVFSGTSRTSVELRALANEISKRIAKRHDWSGLKKIATLTGDGADTDFDLPSDYDRMPVKAKLWSSSEPTLPFKQYTDLDRWLGLEVQDFSTVQDRWIIYGGQIHVVPAIESAATAKFAYLSNLIVASTSTADKVKFTADTDSFALDERLLRLGMLWQWKANKGVPYAEDMENFEEALEQEISRDRGARVVAVGSPRTSLNADYAFPQELGS